MKQVKNLETKVVTRDGREISVNFSASPIKGKGGTLGGVVAVLTDITHLKTLVRNLEKTAQDLKIAKYELERRLAKTTEI